MAFLSFPLKVVLSAGERVQYRPENRVTFSRKCTIPPNSRHLLLLCGDMRCFR